MLICSCVNDLLGLLTDITSLCYLCCLCLIQVKNVARRRQNNDRDLVGFLPNARLLLVFCVCDLSHLF